MSNFGEKIVDDTRKAILDDTLRANVLSNGEIFWVVEDSDTDFNVISQRYGNKNVFTTVAAAYAACTTNRNDIIFISANTAHSAAMLTVSKSRIHFVGLDTGGRMNSQGTRIVTPATDVAASVAVISNSGTRNTYENIKMSQQGTNVAQTSGFIDTGEGTYVKNCSFEVNSILTTVTQAILFKGDTCHYEDCQIGNSTVTHTAANQAPLVIQTPARYSYFINCTIINYSDKTTASCIDCPDANSVIGWIIFENCFLLSASKGDGATAAGAMAEAVTSIATSGYLYFRNCSCAFATAFMEADASLYSDAVAPAAAGAGGIMTPGV